MKKLKFTTLPQLAPVLPNPPNSKKENIFLGRHPNKTGEVQVLSILTRLGYLAAWSGSQLPTAKFPLRA